MKTIYFGKQKENLEKLEFYKIYNFFYRFDNYFVDVDATLEDFAGYIQTWSGFQKFKSVEGNEKAAKVINDFLKE